ncbi:MAG: AgmX/PglI C-terminal domain-containing protein [Nannocystaceae bacterium]
MIRHVPLAIALLALACRRDDQTATPEPTPPTPTETTKPDHSGESSHHKPPVEQGLTIDGALKDADVEAAVNQNIEAVRACYDEALHHPNDEQLGGAIVVSFTVTAAGKVEGAKLELSEFGHAPTEQCLTKLVGTLGFPKQAKPSTVRYPFYLNKY